MGEDRSSVSRDPAAIKALSYARDCRNGYGENGKSSRMAIRRRKAIGNRNDRRDAAQALVLTLGDDEASAALAESSLRHDVGRVGSWTKCPDTPLGEMLARRARRRTGPAARDDG